MELRATRTAASLEGLLLAGLGLFMVVFAFSQQYWMLLNPKFYWLTAVAGGVLTLCGLARAFDRARPAGLPRMLMLVLVLAMCFSLEQWLSQQGEAGGSLTERPMATLAAAPRLEWDGQEYIKINNGELYILAEKGTAQEIERPYVFRGQVASNASLAKLGLFAVLRTSMTCCLADAVSVGFVVSYPGHQPPAPGGWVKAYGRLKPLGGQKTGSRGLGQKGIMFTAVNQRYFFVADHLEPMAPPAIPFMFEFRGSEPYAY